MMSVTIDAYILP